MQTIKQEIANLRSEIEESNDSVDLENQVDKINFELQNLHTEKGQFDEQVTRIKLLDRQVLMIYYHR